MARKEKELKEKSSKDAIRRKDKDSKEDESEAFAPLKVATNIQEAVKEFKVCIQSYRYTSTIFIVGDIN